MSKTEQENKNSGGDMVPNITATLMTQEEVIPAHIAAMLGDKRGNEGVGASEMTLPRLEVVQSLSKVRDENDESYIPGIKEGELYNSLTRENYGKTVTIIPVAFVVEWLGWRDMQLGGGFCGTFATEAEAEKEIAKQDKPEEWEAVKTAQHYCLLVRADGRVESVVLSMAKSKQKVSKRLNSLIMMASGGKLPRWVRKYTVSGIPAVNKNNQKYFTFTVDSVAGAEAWTSQEFLPKAEEMYNLVQSGKVSVDQNYEADFSEVSVDAKFNGGDDI